LHIQGQFNVVRRVTVYKPGRATAIGGDDCIQMLGASDDGLIELCVLDKTGYGPWKQALVAKGDRTVVRFNRFVGPSDGSGLVTMDAGAGMLFYGNDLLGNDGVYALNPTAPHYVHGNVAKGTNATLTNAESTGIDQFSSPTRNHAIINNTIMGHRRGIFGEGCTVRNNLVMRCGGTGVDTGSGATAESNNAAFDNATNFSGTPGAGSVTTDYTNYVASDGQLVVPADATRANIASKNPLAIAGTYVQGIHLRNGRMRPGWCPIGAYQAVLPRAARA
jgi:hypothetical protein